MGKPSGQGSYGLKFLELLDPGFQSFTFFFLLHTDGNIPVNAPVSLQVSHGIKNGNPVFFKNDTVTVFMEVYIFQSLKGSFGGRDILESLMYLIGLFRGHEIKKAFTHEFFRAISHDILYRRARVGIDEVLIHFPDKVTGSFNKGAVLFLTLFQ